MSLTNLVNSNNPIRNKMRTWFPKPRFQLDIDLLVPPKADDRSLIGTAFDYLVRFDLERRHKFAVVKPWIAQRSLAPIKVGLSDWFPDPDIVERLAENFVIGKKEHRIFLETGQITDELLLSVLGLAKCDIYYRAREFSEEEREDVLQAQIAELRQLSEILNRDALQAKEFCLLNPEFGIASRALGGADADLLLDDCLVEIKTKEKPQLRIEDWRQMLGYAALNEHFPMGGQNSSPVRSIGFYFARHGYLLKWPLAHIVDRTRFKEFSLIVAKYVKEHYANRLLGPPNWQTKIARDYEKDVKALDREIQSIRSSTKLKKQPRIDRRSSLERSRRRYCPDLISWLFVAEAPPSSPDRFFYYEEVDKHDWLFLALVRSFYEDIAPMPVKEIRASKRELLRRLQSDGFYLVDSCPKPLHKRTSKEHQVRNNLPSLLQTLDSLRDDGRLTPSTRIVLVSKTVFEECNPVLRDNGFGVVNAHSIPFPIRIRQDKFKALLESAIAGSCLLGC